MVAPTRTPQARGVKCDLCKKILSLATWLDQTKLAKKAEDAKLVLALIDDHNRTDCPCIPKNIENLLIGSTHFEIHRLFIKDLDVQVHKIQYELYQEAKHKNLAEASRAQTAINDCYDTKRGSRFKNYKKCFELKQCEKAKLLVQHLKAAIDFWATAMEDQANPFNSKLALRLGLTHHVVYACYLFKFYKILDYQLKTSVLLLNVFKSIEGVTPNAILHANYLLIRTLIDSAQFLLARQYLKQAIKLSIYRDKSFYESILLSCVECELRLLDESENDKFSILDDLAELVTIKEDDKLQHYYARTLAMSTIIRYIQYYRSKSDNCFEFFHTFRFVCAIIRRCYETSFALVLSEKESSRQQSNSPDGSLKQNQILDHNWIRFAVCDFSFSTFDVLSNFYIRAGMPECLELLFNGLNLIAYRSGSVYWQSRMMGIGVELDLLCDKFTDAETKLDSMSRIVSYTNDPLMMNLLRLESEVSFLSLIREREKSVIKKDVMLDLLERMKACHQAQMDKISQVKIYDCKSNSINDTLTDQACFHHDFLLSTGNSLLLRLGLTLLRKGISSLLDIDITSPDAKYFITKISDQFGSDTRKALEFYTCQLLLETIIQFTSIRHSEQLLLDTVNSSSLFLKVDAGLGSLQSQLSSLTLNNDIEKVATISRRTRKTSSKNGGTKISRIPLSRRSKRKGTYEVAIKSEENLREDDESVQVRDPLEVLQNFSSISKEEIILSYLKHSEANPYYLNYRRAHELMLCMRLTNYESSNNDKILFHFTESISSNTMRYRWMMYEEQQATPYDPTSSRSDSATCGDANCNRTKFLNFTNLLTNTDKLVKSMTRLVPEDFRLCQFRYIWDERSDQEHLVVMCFDNTNDLVCIHTKRSPISDEFFDDARNNDMRRLAIPKRLEAKIEESRRSLFTSSKTRSELRQKLEADVGVILHDLEHEWLGPFRFILCAKTCDYSYNKMINELASDINSLMLHEYPTRTPSSALKMLLEGAPLLTRDEFCNVISILYNCPSDSGEPRQCFNKWLRAIESFIEEQDLNISKTALLKKLPRGQIGLILDQRLEHIPFESLPAVRVAGQGMFRVPSLRLYSCFASRRCMPIKIDSDRVAYVLDPANNLAKTRERFDQKFRANKSWLGVIGQSPSTEQLEMWLSKEQLYIFIGHGAGTVYYNKLYKGRGLSAMDHVESAAIVMGCSSGRMVAEGPRLESFGVGWAFLFRGSPCYVGLLWDVTDMDIDKYTDYLLCEWLPSKSYSSDLSLSLSSSNGDQTNSGTQAQVGSYITNISIFARQVCQLKFLVGSAPVVYGLPISCKN